MPIESVVTEHRLMSFGMYVNSSDAWKIKSIGRLQSLSELMIK